MNEQINEQSHEELTRVVESEVKKMSIIQRIISLFVSPGELMYNIKAYPVVLIPLLLAIAIGLASIPLTMQTSDLMSRELSNISIERYGIDLMNLAMGMDEYGEDLIATAMGTVMLVTTVASVIVMPPLVSFFVALGLLILSKIARGSAKLGQLFSMYLHVYILSSIGALISMWLMTLTGNYLDMTSLAAVIMPEGNISMISFNALSYISVFTIWATILTFIGVKITNDFSDVKAGVVTLIAFLVGIAIHVGTFMSTFILWDITMNMGM